MAICIPVLLLLGLPMAGVLLAGLPLARYLEFPPRSAYIIHAPFSWPVFVLVAAIEIAILIPLIKFPRPIVHPSNRPFPPWGYWGVGVMGAAWLLAWTRFPWFAPLQAHTFTPLWLSYIICVNALTFRRAGRCLLANETGYLLKLFPASAAFWWLFEYLNRFTQNWRYLGADHFSPLEYFIFATLSFSTVLPAVLSTAELLETCSRRTEGGETRAPPSRRYRIVLLVLSCAGLLLVGVFPNLLFPLLWLAPLGVLQKFQSLELLQRKFPIVGTFTHLAAAALVCGFFWEMWNYYSLAKWVYDIPFVGRFKIFEMPALGYFGYLPFGWTCGVIAACLKPRSLHILRP